MSDKPILLDTYCKAGGCTKGYERAGFYVVGVDIEPQPNYCGDEFYQADAIEFIEKNWRRFDVIHASPPCQGYTRFNQGLLQAQKKSKTHPLLIEPTRNALSRTGLPYVIENVHGAPLINPVQLCGSSFGLLVERHRLFESNIFLMSIPCAHGWQKFDKPPLHSLNGHRKAARSRVFGVYGNGRGKGETVAAWSAAMGIDWMNRRELAQAIPPPVHGVHRQADHEHPGISKGTCLMVIAATALPVAPVAFVVPQPCALITPRLEPNVKTRTLWRDGCETFTSQALVRVDGQKWYQCDCGERLIYFVVAKVSNV